MLKQTFREKSQTIRLYIGKEVSKDPFKDITDFELLACYPIKAIVSDLNFTQIQWKLSGVNAEKAKLIVFKNKDLSLLKESYKIEINGNFYYGWKVYGELQFRQEEEYTQAYVYVKKEV